ncbi:MAG: hypothetical protein QF578_21490 [Alphaproteobacteria bacterium]|nr:hypothetical protein [Alphaproteobacteria bacterium]MDP6567418.1 hypothetical protein [Alphaproteobacteria bacterium]MDP6814350.1 hypothetical protein [Alphaproteobacteria bacterium]
MRPRLLLLIATLAVLPASALAECKPYTSKAMIQGREEVVTGTVCRQRDGSWRIMTSRPAQGDHDRARAAVASGAALPLSDILTRLQPEHPGEMLDAELRPARRDGVWQYLIKLLGTDNVVRRLTVDAQTGQVLHIDGER